MFILLLPVPTICVALVGFYVWHRQLIRKRHFEVAETALSAFSRADAALAYARAYEDRWRRIDSKAGGRRAARSQ